MKKKKDQILGMPKSEPIKDFHVKDLADRNSTKDMPSKNTARGDVYPKK